jgi:cell wall-associated NlpC family hydrolase
MYHPLPRRKYIWFSLILLFILGLLFSHWLRLNRNEALPGLALGRAMTRLNFPYVYGGKGPDRFDCSGLVVWSYQAADPGLKFRRKREVAGYANADELWRYNVKRISPGKMKPGDLVFFTDNFWTVSHTGLFVAWVNPDEFQYIHASSSKRRVTISVWSMRRKVPGFRFVGVGKLIIRE